MSSEDILQQLRDSYLLGIPHHLEEMESYILSMEKGEDFQDNFEALFRKAHSLKGSGGTYGFSIITSTCHQMEDFISDTMRNPEDIDQQVIDSIFKYIDILKDTQSLLMDGVDKFDDVEIRLKILKGNSSSAAISGIYVGVSSNLHQLCMQVFSKSDVHCISVDNALSALQRIIHEHFDFIITSKENPDLNGLALIAAIKLNKITTKKVRTILITSNQPIGSCETTNPDYIVLKNRSFDVSLLNVLEEIKKTQ